MDEIDSKLIMFLQQNSRMPVSEMSKMLKLSRPSIAERMQRLQDQGIIEEYSARISLKAIGREIVLFIQFKLLKVSPVTFEKKVIDDPDILECHRVTGEIDYLIKAAVRSMEDMRSLIDRLMPYGDLNTSIVILSPIAYRHVMP